MQKVQSIIIFIVFFSFVYYPIDAQEVKIDHIILLHRNLEESIKDYQSKGFTVKKGRVHNNGIINAHIKFENKSSVELISLKGEVNDEISKRYENLLKYGEGGVYIALTGIPFKELSEKLNYLNVPYKRIDGKLWDYITFPDSSKLSQFFFIDYHIELQDSSYFFEHGNQSDLIKTVQVEGGNMVVKFLEGLGLKKEKVGDNFKFVTTSGNLILFQPKKENKFKIKKNILADEKGDVTKIISF